MSDNLPSIVEFDDDIANAEAPVPLPASEYPATIRGVEVKLSNSGNKYAAVAFHISPDAYPADFPVEEEPDGVTLIYRRATLENNKRARYNLRKFCEAIGAPMSKSVDVNEWVGLTAVIETALEEYEGEPRASVKSVKTEA